MNQYFVYCTIKDREELTPVDVKKQKTAMQTMSAIREAVAKKFEIHTDFVIIKIVSKIN